MVPYRRLRHLLAPRSAGLRHAVDAAAALLGGRTAASRAAVDQEAGRHRPVESGPGGDDGDELLLGGGSTLVLHWVRRPPVVLVALLAALAVGAARDLVGAGSLLGGALVPGPDRAADLWDSYRATWHPLGLGATTVAPPWVAALAGLARILPGGVETAVTLLLVGCPPLAGLSAYLASSRLVQRRSLRFWAAAVWGTAPALTGAVASGRIGTAAVMIVLPPLALAGVRALSSWRAAAVAAALLSLATAFVPATWLVLAPLALAAAVLGSRGPAPARRLRPLLVAAVPVLLLAPWTLLVRHEPRLLLAEAGLPGPGLADPRLDPVAVVLGHPGGPGAYPLVATAGLAVAALAALLRSTRRRVVLAAWATVAVAAVAGVLISRATVPSLVAGGTEPAWPGVACAVVVLGLLVAAVVGADGVRDRIRGTSFGWRQPLIVLVLVLCVATPVVAAASFVRRGAGDPLQRAQPADLPAFVVADAAEPAHPRTLVLSGTRDHVTYNLLRTGGLQLGDAEIGRVRAGSDPLAPVVADLVAGRGGDTAARLRTFAVGHVLVAGRLDRALAESLDGAPGLGRVAAEGVTALWAVQGPVGRLRIAGTGQVLASGVTGADTTVDPAAGARTLVLAERRAPGWRARLDGRPLRRVTVDGWAQGFAVPAGAGGRLRIAYDRGDRPHWLLGQGAGLVLLLLVALPRVRRREVDDDDDVGGPLVPGARTGRRGRHGPAGEQGPDTEPVLPGVSVPVGGGAP